MVCDASQCIIDLRRRMACMASFSHAYHIYMAVVSRYRTPVGSVQ